MLIPSGMQLKCMCSYFNIDFQNRAAETPHFMVCSSVGVCNFVAFCLQTNSCTLLGTALPGRHRKAEGRWRKRTKVIVRLEGVIYKRDNMHSLTEQ